VAATTSTCAAYAFSDRGLYQPKFATTTAGATSPEDLEESARKKERQLAFRKKWEDTVKQMQTDVCTAIETVDGEGKFRLDEWTRPEGGGGWTKVLTEGKVFEKAGVNVSAVFGELPPAAAAQMKSRGLHLPGASATQKAPFFACGVSLVIHPHNPMAPTVHANYRYFEVMDPESGETIWWFGGGSDLTPSYLFEEDAIEFHRAKKKACDKHDPSLYPRFKKWCDEYFYLPHRGETRGIGGIFYDDLDEIATAPKAASTEEQRKEALRQFAISCCAGLVESYVPIIERRKNMKFTEEQKRWQQLRRGRYVEFNIGIDRGTKFGMQTPGSRIESILMSLPLTARWEYMHSPTPGSEEDKMLKVLQHPRDWLQ
jgi:coproporphyrinogen III oxidase